MKPISLIIIALFSFQIAAQKTYRDSVDVCHYHIHLDLSDLKNPVLKGKTVLKITPRCNKLESIGLDLQGLQTDSVLFNKKTLAFSLKNNVLRISLEKKIMQNDTVQISVFYHGKPQKDDAWGGFFITGTYAFNYGIGMAAVPPNFGRVWFPCIDNFTDRATYEYSITVKKSNSAACPGILQEIIPAGDNEVWYWRLSESIPTYLSSVAVSDYKILKDTVQGIEKRIPIEIFIKKNEYEAGKKSFVHVKDFLHAFENAYGAYVWEKIGYVSTPFKGGAMEHATNIAYSANCKGSLQCENTLAHELSHHWFGNLITCHSEKDMWLNEGWASYSESIFREYFYGKKDVRDYNRTRHKQVLQFAHLYDGGYLPLYGIPHEYTYGFTIYEKGADVAHALRGYLGDSLFFSALKQYFRDYAFKDISVAEFRDYLSKQTKVNLKDFFDFWIFNAGFPHFSAEYFSVKKQGKKYNVAIKISQRLKEAPHCLKTPLEIAFLDVNWQLHKQKIQISGDEQKIEHKTNYKALLLIIDPDEKIPDATTHEYRIIKNKEEIQFNNELFSLQANELKDSAFIYIIHHWIKPLINTEQKNEYNFAQRYWSVNYLPDENFTASAKFYFDLSYALDGELAKYGARKIQLFYRENPDNNWMPIESKQINDGRKSYFILNLLKKGEYTIGTVK